MRKSIITCRHCGEEKPERTRGLCSHCWYVLMRQGKLDLYPSKLWWAKTPKYGKCPECGKNDHLVKDICINCYTVKHRQSPEAKKRHAETEKKRRKKLGEAYLIKERERYRGEKRVQWRKVYQKKYYQEHAEELKQYQVEWRKENPEQYKYYYRKNHRARKNAGKTTPKQWKQIIAFYVPDNRCPSCGNPFSDIPVERMLTMDHVVPINCGGTNWPDNLQPLCYSCNASKNDGSSIDYRFDKGAFARTLMEGIQ